ncbi:N-formylglutamate amidohydrolase [Elioraea rosea]|uniref:N-formylglutamate amidohydrolase n=1 Tax=Elioraea rosea TaxID=2492390 RepID=UPI0011829201|nr:N-formylglutamate amidohydrolase [Elioraea rosea]
MHLVPGVLVRHDPPRGVAPVPVVFDSPHSGRVYPDDFGAVLPVSALRGAEDAFVEELFSAAPEHGAVLLAALFPRSYIDGNRAPDDIDPRLIEGEWPAPLKPGPKSDLGIGLIRRAVVPGLFVYDRRLTVAEVERRIARYWRRYHAALKGALDRAHRAHGAVWHIDCHSMKSVANGMTPDAAGTRRRDIVLGDRDGTSCEPGFTRLVKETLERFGFDVAVNDPYKGAEIVRRYGDPATGRHSLQVEIRRDLFMNEAVHVRNEGFARVQAAMGDLAAAVCDYARARSRALG